MSLFPAMRFAKARERAYGTLIKTGPNINGHARRQGCSAILVSDVRCERPRPTKKEVPSFAHPSRRPVNPKELQRSAEE